VTKYVASTTLDKADWNNSHVLSGDVADAVAKLKEQDGPEIQVHGSGHLLQTLLQHGLVDEVQLMVFPVVLGAGKRLFADDTAPTALRMLDSTVSTTGVIVATYAPAGAIDYGSFQSLAARSTGVAGAGARGSASGFGPLTRALV
jgi:dihydrofolate reductase